MNNDDAYVGAPLDLAWRQCALASRCHFLAPCVKQAGSKAGIQVASERVPGVSPCKASTHSPTLTNAVVPPKDRNLEVVRSALIFSLHLRQDLRAGVSTWGQEWECGKGGQYEL